MKRKKPIVPIKDRSAKTAGFACICRAQSFFEHNSLLKTNDYIAPIMIPLSIKVLLKLNIIKLISKLAPKSTYAYIVARTKFFDAVFNQSIINNFEQIVSFCPGYDSRGIRFLNTTTTKLFELDVKNTQAKKLKQLQKKKIYIPDGITFIPIDFENESIKERLLASEFKGNKKTLFVLEGTFMVLNKKTMDNIFELFNSITSKDSEVLFDYIDRPVSDDNKKLQLISLLDSNDLENKYYNTHNKTLKKINKKHFIALAKKNS